MIVIDMDDICLNDGPSANGMHWMYYLKGKYPSFKINLFCIPGRSNKRWMEMLASHDWISICIHGWNHDEKEEVPEEGLVGWNFTRIYKGPNWKVTEEELGLLARHNFILAVKDIYTWKIRQWPLADPRAVHGHVWVESDWQRIERRLSEDNDCRFIQEVV